MAKFGSFHYSNLADLRADIVRLGVDLPLDEDLAPLQNPVAIGPYHAPNALGVQPMEGCDATPDGAPGELAFRRYRRFAAGGAGLIWVEATAVTPAGRANPRQFCLTTETLPTFTRLVAETKRIARQSGSPGSDPMLVLQLTHSGRFSRPNGPRQPVIAQHHPLLDAALGLPPDYPLVSDSELDRLIEEYVRAAQLARSAGFDAVDLKASHGYLAWELLSARTRPGRYGGKFAGRTRFLVSVFEAVRQVVGDDLVLGARLNYYDPYPFPYSWGADREDPARPDLAEPLELTRLLVARGLALLNVTAGVPQHRAYVTRPFNKCLPGGALPPEHPLEGVARLLGLAAAAQAAFPLLPVVGSGYSWLRQFFGQAAAGQVGRGRQAIAAVGRLAIAYPDFARDLLERGTLDRKKVCQCCSKCSLVMIKGGRTGCVVRDAEVYMPSYRECVTAG